MNIGNKLNKYSDIEDWYNAIHDIIVNRDMVWKLGKLQSG